MRCTSIQKQTLIKIFNYQNKKFNIPKYKDQTLHTITPSLKVQPAPLLFRIAGDIFTGIIAATLTLCGFSAEPG